MAMIRDVPITGTERVSPKIRMIRKALWKWFIDAPCTLSDGGGKKK